MWTKQSRWKSRLAENWPAKRGNGQKTKMGLVESWRLMLGFVGFIGEPFRQNLSAVVVLGSAGVRMTTKMEVNWRNDSKTKEKVQSSTSSFSCERLGKTDGQTERGGEIEELIDLALMGNIEMKIYSDKRMHCTYSIHVWERVRVRFYRDIISLCFAFSQ